MALLELERLTVTYPGGGPAALDGVSLRLRAAECVGLAGESGSGKTTLAHAVLRLLPPGTATSGRVVLDGEDVTTMSWGRLRAVRWAGASVVFQGAQHSLDPVRTVLAHLVGPIRLHGGCSRAVAAERAAVLLEQVGLGPEHVARHPHQLSGGQRQLVLIAMALACSPRLVIADEPTTALDPPARAQVLGLLRDLVRDRGLGLLLVSHDLPLLASSCDGLVILQGGRVVQRGPTRRVIARPRHPYPATLLAGTGRFGDPAWRFRAAPPQGGGATAADGRAAEPRRRPDEPLLRVRGLTVAVPGRRGAPTTVVADVDLDLHGGEVLAVIGEVGAGKTTLARALVGLVPLSRGRVLHAGTPLERRPARLREVRARAQYVPQEPMSALNRRHPVRRAVAEGPLLHGVPAAEAARTVDEVLAEVGLRPVGHYLDRWPHELSAGQQQRVVLAAALALRPRLLIVDEPVASLDASARNEILGVLLRRRAQGVGVVLVTHDLTAAWQVADRVAVLRDGRLVEQGPAEDVLRAPRAAYTRRLVDAQIDLPSTQVEGS